jgi:hypothetical protein
MRFDSRAPYALAAALAMLLLAGLGFRAAVHQLEIVLRKERIDLRGPLNTIPGSLLAPGVGGLPPGREWKQADKDVILSQPIVEELGTEVYLNRELLRRADDRNDRMSLHIAYYTGLIDAVPHVPERCWVAAGGLTPVGTPRDVPLLVDLSRATPSSAPPNRATGDLYAQLELMDAISRRFESVHLPIGEFGMRVSEYQSEDDPNKRHLGGYCFIANGRITPSAGGVRALAFQPSERHAYFCKIQFAMLCSAEEEDRWERFQQLSSEVFNQILPHLMRRLPDWPQVEAGQSTE